MTQAAQRLLQEAAQRLAARRPAEALALIERGLVASPLYPPLLSLKGVALADAGRAAAGLAAVRAAAAAAPRWADGQANLGYVLQATGDARAAEAALRAALKLAPGHVVAAMNLANLLMRLGRQDEAIALYRRTPADAPGQVQLRYNLALALRQTGARAEALVQFLEVLARAPRHLEAANHAAALHLEESRPAEALALLERALAVAPGHARSHNNRGTALRALGHGEAALAAYRQAARLAPEVAETWRNIGLLAADLGRLEEAAEAFRQALAREPGDSVAQHMLDAAEGRTTPKPPGNFLALSFDAFAPTFEQQLVGRLGYRAPWALAALAERLAPGRRYAEALDIGCGTGLVAEAFDESAARWTGLDLSPRMLALATAKGRYARLEEQEATAFLAADATRYDLAVAADLLIYLGDIAPLLQAVAARLQPGALLLVSTERCRPEEGDSRLRSSGRYAQSDAYVEAAAAAAGLTVLAREDTVLRQQHGQPVEGSLFALGSG